MEAAWEGSREAERVGGVEFGAGFVFWGCEGGRREEGDDEEGWGIHFCGGRDEEIKFRVGL